MLVSIVLLVVLTYAIRNWEMSVKMTVNVWTLELTKTKTNDWTLELTKTRTKTKTKTKTKTTKQLRKPTPKQRQTSHAKTKTNKQLKTPTTKLSSHYTDGFYSSIGDIITIP